MNDGQHADASASARAGTGRLRRVGQALFAWVLAVAAVAAEEVPPARGSVLDTFDDVRGWQAHPADGVDLAIRSDTGAHGPALRLDFNFRGGGGYAVARKAFDLDLPANYVFSFRIRGEAQPNHLEFKLLDSSGENVWWSVRRDVTWPRDWETWRIKKRHVQFAWGPQGGSELRHVAAIEFVVTAGSGGAGRVWIDDFELQPLPPPEAVLPPVLASASSARRTAAAARAVDGDSTTVWESAPGDRRPTLTLDFQGEREFGGLVLDWEPGRHAADYLIETSWDGTAWQSLRTVRGANGGQDFLCLPESETRFLRLRVERAAAGSGVGLAELRVQPLEWGATREAFFQALARTAPRGSFPRAITGEQVFWTVVGADADPQEALLSEDGALETGMGQFSIEPFLFDGGKLWTWAEAYALHSRVDGSLPIPRVTWRADELGLEILAFPIGPPGGSAIVARYRVTNRTSRRKQGTLYLALRPFQVNPPAQFLNVRGGTAPIADIAFDGKLVRVNGTQRVLALQAPAGFGAVPFDGGDMVTDFLRAGRLPKQATVHDTFAAASGALAFRFDLAPGAAHEVDLVVPLYPELALPSLPAGDRALGAWVEESYDTACATWRAKLRRVEIELPDSAVTRTLESQLGCILVNRAGPAIQPGTRSYARSWIRDGALTSTALLRLGHADAVRAFIDWFAPHQYASGKIPCVVDRRGADPTPEHDSSGEFIYLVAEYVRYSGDREYAARLWPRVRAAVGYLDSLRGLRRTPEYEVPARRHFYGLLPPSISHEGYSAKPMHSYWDDLWALRGFRDGVRLAVLLGNDAEAGRIAAIRDQFADDLASSVQAAMRLHGVDYVPGCADLGDFDATSTTIALSPVQAQDVLPPAALARTFEKYWEFFCDRRAGAPWEAYTPYELRNVGAFVHLGWRERAHEAAAYFFEDQKPPGWRQWAEVVWREERIPRFIGDLPHTWVGSDFIRSILDMLVYEREADQALVLGAGVPRAWLQRDGVRVRGLPTPYGPLGFTMREESGTAVITIDAGLQLPPGGLVLLLPDAVPPSPTDADTNNRGEQVVRALPATVRVPMP